jgi:hypothetical protein
MFLDSVEFKSDLRWLADDWSSLSEAERESRYYDYGSYSPENPDSITHILWKKYMKPRSSRSGNIRMSEEQEKMFLQQLQPFFNAIDKYNKGNDS